MGGAKQPSLILIRNKWRIEYAIVCTKMQRYHETTPDFQGTRSHYLKQYDHQIVINIKTLTRIVELCATIKIDENWPLIGIFKREFQGVCGAYNRSFFNDFIHEPMRVTEH